MMQVQLEFTGASRRHLADLARKTPRTFRAAHAAAARHARNRLRKVLRVGGGLYGVPVFAPHDPMTQLLRPGGKVFGQLAEKWAIVCYKRGEGQIVGWMDAGSRGGNARKGDMTSYASAVQSAQSYAFTAKHKMGLRMYEKALAHYPIPSMYNRPARPVIDPFADHLAGEFPDMVLKEFDRKVARDLKKGRVIA